MISLAEIDYLMETGSAARVVLAGRLMVSVEDLRSYLCRHGELDYSHPMPGEDPEQTDGGAEAVLAASPNV